MAFFGNLMILWNIFLHEFTISQFLGWVVSEKTSDKIIVLDFNKDLSHMNFSQCHLPKLGHQVPEGRNLRLSARGCWMIHH